MAPEQACGDVEGLDERCDVFGLGAMLCEVLTGSPPYRGREMGELLRKAARADLTEAFERLDACGAEAELVRLAKACLSAEPAERPCDAGAVATAMTAHLAGVQERLREAELERAAAQARAEAAQAKTRAERRARRMTVALAATLLLAVTCAGAGALWYQHDQHLRTVEHDRRAAATERDVTAALEEAKALGKQAATLKADPAKWGAALTVALSAVKRAEGVLDNGEGGEDLRARVAAQRAELEVADRDRRMIAGLEAARFRGAAAGREGGFDNAGAVALYRAAFRQDDKDWDSLAPDEAAARINRRAIRNDMLAALAVWSNITTNKQNQERFRRVLQAADPDPASFPNRGDAALEKKDVDGLRRLADSSEAQDQPTVRLVMLARDLTELNATAEAVKLLKEANERRPGDFWIVFELAYAYGKMKPPMTGEAIRYNTAAVALRPDSAAAHYNLGYVLYDKHQLDEAIAEFKKAIVLEPDLALAHTNLGVALYGKHRLDEAMTEYRKAVALEPGLAMAHNNLGYGLFGKHPDEAMAEFKKAVALEPGLAMAHNNLGRALYDKHPDEALAEYRKAVALDPDLALAHANLGLVLYERRQVDEAITELKKAIALDSGLAPAHFNLGRALYGERHLDEAMAEFKKAVALDPDLALAHNNLGLVLYDKHRFDEAVAEYQKALALDPGLALAHTNLGNALYGKHQVDEAIEEYRKALQIQPDLALAHTNLGFALYGRRQVDEAMTEYKKAVALDPGLALAHTNLGFALYGRRQVDEAIAEFKKALQIQPDYALAHNNLGLVLYDKHRFDEALAEYRKAVALDPDLALAHANLGLVLIDRRQLDEAITELKKAVALEPDNALAHYNLGRALYGKRQVDEAMTEFKRAVALGPDLALAHNNLGLVLYDKGQLDAAVTEYRKAVALNPDLAEPHNNLGNALYGKHQVDEAITEYQKALQLQPDNATAHNNLGYALFSKRLVDEAIEEYRKAIELEPGLALAHNNLGFALYGRRQVDEAIAEFKKTLQIQPDNALAHYNLGYALDAENRLDEAIAEYRKAVQIQPDFALTYNNLGLVLYDKHRIDEAIAEFKKAVALKPDYALAHVHLGVALDAKGQSDEAIAEFRKALQIQPDLAEAAYNAACADALAGCGQGKGAANADEKERGRRRQQAQDWLRIALKLWTTKIDEGKPEYRAAAAKALRHSQEDSDLAGVRDKDALAKLPADEQDAWRNSGPTWTPCRRRPRRRDGPHRRPRRIRFTSTLSPNRPPRTPIHTHGGGYIRSRMRRFTWSPSWRRHRHGQAHQERVEIPPPAERMSAVRRNRQADDLPLVLPALHLLSCRDVPKNDRPVEIGDHRPPAVGQERDLAVIGVPQFLPGAQAAEQHPGRRVPDQHVGVVVVHCQGRGPVRRQRQSDHLVGTGQPRLDFLAALHVIAANRPQVRMDDEQPPAVRRERQRRPRVVLGGGRHQPPARGHVPNAGRVVVGRGDAPAVRREDPVEDAAARGGEATHLPAGFDVPEDDGPRRHVAGQGVFAVGREGGEPDRGAEAADDPVVRPTAQQVFPAGRQGIAAVRRKGRAPDHVVVALQENLVADALGRLDRRPPDAHDLSAVARQSERPGRHLDDQPVEVAVEADVVVAGVEAIGRIRFAVDHFHDLAGPFDDDLDVGVVRVDVDDALLRLHGEMERHRGGGDHKGAEEGGRGPSKTFPRPRQGGFHRLQLFDDFAGRRRPAGGVLGQQSHHQRRQRGRHGAVDAGRRPGVIGGHGHQRGEGVAAAERHFACRHAVEDAAEAEQVGAGVHLAAVGLLGCHERRRADDDPFPGKLGVGGVPDQAEVEDPHADLRNGRPRLARSGFEPDVGGLDVAVDQAAGVGRRQSLRDLPADPQALNQRQRLLAAEAVLQRLAGQQGHGDEGNAAVLADLIDGNDVVMAGGGGRPALAQEAAAGRIARGQTGQHRLERDGPAQDGIFRAEDDAHTALAEYAQDATPAQATQLVRLLGRSQKVVLPPVGRLIGRGPFRRRDGLDGVVAF